MANEADTCRRYVLPRLQQAGWADDQINEQRTITNGRIVMVGKTHVHRLDQKRADYILRYRPDLMIAVVEAKADYKKPGDGLQQAKDYAQMLDIKFAYSTNGTKIVEHDFLTGKERDLESFPSPDELWNRLTPSVAITQPATKEKFLSPSYPSPKKPLRYYQEIAVNRVIQSILGGKRRILLTMATGTGKTEVAFQICWKLWSTKWNSRSEPRKPRILYLSDRTFLVDDPKARQFAPFEHARHKIEGEAIKSREMYFATYQSIAQDERRPGLYREYAPDYFDFIVVDECHRGSARDESNWREILEYYEPAYQLGMTATPLREENKDTYTYFGNPVYTYSLRQGIEDGFLAPCRVHRIVPDVDATGYRPASGELDKQGRPIPDQEYMTPDFERVLSHAERTQAIARSITQFLKENDRFAKTIIFCVDMEHAEEMRKALSNENSDLVQKYPDYVVRIVSEDGKQYLSNFQELEKITPAIVTTSRLLSTGVDVPTCKVVVIARMVQSMTEFKQIIGRGTRVRDDYNKYFFTILDYTGSATRHFADPEFDGEPVEVTETPLGDPVSKPPETVNEPTPPPLGPVVIDPPEAQARKLYVDGQRVEMAAHVVYELDAEGRRLKAIRYTDYVSDKLGKLYRSAADLRSRWSRTDERAAIIEELKKRGIGFDDLVRITKQPEADPFDLLCHVAFNLPIKTRRERADLLKKNNPDFFRAYSEKARSVLDAILEKYVEYGATEFKLPDILRVDPLPKYGNVVEISAYFGSPDKLRQAVDRLQNLLYAA